MFPPRPCAALSTPLLPPEELTFGSACAPGFAGAPLGMVRANGGERADGAAVGSTLPPPSATPCAAVQSTASTPGRLSDDAHSIHIAAAAVIWPAAAPAPMVDSGHGLRRLAARFLVVAGGCVIKARGMTVAPCQWKGATREGQGSALFSSGRSRPRVNRFCAQSWWGREAPCVVGPLPRHCPPALLAACSRSRVLSTALRCNRCSQPLLRCAKKWHLRPPPSSRDANVLNIRAARTAFSKMSSRTKCRRRTGNKTSPGQSMTTKSLELMCNKPDAYGEWSLHLIDIDTSWIEFKHWHFEGCR